MVGCWYRVRGVGISGHQPKTNSKNIFSARFSVKFSMEFNRQISVILDYIFTVSEHECEIPAKFGKI